MKIALAQLNFHIGNFESNALKIVDAIENAKGKGADLVVFPELAVCGYPPRDLLEFDDFINKVENSITIIAKKCIGIAAVVGAPRSSTLKRGKKLYNSAFVLADGEVKFVYDKQLLPTYDIFDENRYFEAGSNSSCFEFKGKKIAITICEDLWNVEGNFTYKSSPMEKMLSDKPEFIINIAASPFHKSQAEKRSEILSWNSKKYNLPIYYVNHVGAQTELVFDGGSSSISANGSCVSRTKYFEEEILLVEEGVSLIQSSHSVNEKIEKALVLGIKDYFKKLGFKKATLGLSGGIDSALTLVLACKALGSENVIPILLPSQFSSEHSVEDSLQLCANLDCEPYTIPIEETYVAFEKSLKPLFKELPFGLAEENLQARIRGTMLMAYSNKFGAIVLNTSNKSEMAVGYGTLYGDMCGGLSVIGDLYKTEVFDFCKFLNRTEELIPWNIITKPPSAELRPNQKDSDSLPDYEVLDKVLEAYIERKKGPDEIIALGFDKEIVLKTLRLVNSNEYKRYQSAPILRLSTKAFGMGRRMPIVGKYLN